MKYILLLTLSFTSFAGPVASKREALRSISAVLEVDKSKGAYKEALSQVDIYPKIDWKNFDRLQNSHFHGHIKKLLPYLLLKTKNNDLSTQGKIFRKLLLEGKKIANFVSLSPSDSAIFSFIVEKLRVEKELKSCSDIKAQYRGQEPLMKAQLQRVDFQDKDYLSKELQKVTNRIRFIKLDN